jgi:hypothetical protein
MTRAEAHVRVKAAVEYLEGRFDTDALADDILLALDGALVLEPTIANFSGLAHSVTDVTT